MYGWSITHCLPAAMAEQPSDADRHGHPGGHRTQAGRRRRLRVASRCSTWTAGSSGSTRCVPDGRSTRTAVSGRYAHHVPVRTAFCRCRASSGCTRPDSGSLPGSASSPPTEPARPPTRSRGSVRSTRRPPTSCWTSASSSSSARSARPASAISLGLVDVGLQVADPLLVRPSGLLVQRRPGTGADVAAPDELEAMHLLLRAGQQDRQVAQTLAVPDPAGLPAPGHRPGGALPFQGRSGLLHRRGRCWRFRRLPMFRPAVAARRSARPVRGRLEPGPRTPRPRSAPRRRRAAPDTRRPIR